MSTQIKTFAMVSPKISLLHSNIAEIYISAYMDILILVLNLQIIMVSHLIGLTLLWGSVCCWFKGNVMAMLVTSHVFL